MCFKVKFELCISFHTHSISYICINHIISIGNLQKRFFLWKRSHRTGMNRLFEHQTNRKMSGLKSAVRRRKVVVARSVIASPRKVIVGL